MLSMAAFAILFSISSCHKGDATTATIDIMEPILGDTIAFNEELHLEGSITGNGKMYGYKLIFADAFSGNEFESMTSEEKSKSYSFHEHWINQVTDTTMVTVKVEATLNYDGMKTVKYLQVLCLPQ